MARGKLMTSRRSFIRGSAALLASPSIVRAAGGSVPPYIGPVATGCALADSIGAQPAAPVIGNVAGTAGVCIPQTSTVYGTTSLSRTPCVMMDTPSTIQVVVPTWYVSAPYSPDRCGDSNEVIQPAPNNHCVAIEWTNGGPLVQVTFRGGQIVPDSQAGGINFVSDPVANQASVGQRFWVWIVQGNQNGIIYRDRSAGRGDSPNGEAWIYNLNQDVINYIYANGLTGLSYQNFASYGTVLNGVANQYTFRPLAILGLTTKPTVAFIGDSRGSGMGDDYFDGSGFVGNMERSIGPNFAYLQLSRYGESAGSFITNGTRRMQLASMCSHVIENLGGNDLFVGVSSTTLIEYKSLIWNALAKPLNRIFTMTIDPATTSSDFWTSAANQAALQIAPQVTQYNSSIRGLSNGVNVVDTAMVVEPPWTGTENFIWGNSTYAISSFTQAANGEVVANLASTAGLTLGGYVAVNAAGGGAGVYVIETITTTAIQLYQSSFSGQNWSGGGTLSASLCATYGNGAGVADGIHANPTGYQKIANSGVLAPGLIHF